VKPETVAAVKKKGYSGALWLLVVLAIGIASGFFLSVFEQVRGFRFGPSPPFGALEPVMTLRVVFSTTNVALLVALLVVYAKMYVETKANFSLGLVVVLAALLLHSLISYPLLVVRAGPIPIGPGEFLSTADIFMLVAYAIFLYLSLE
jgi:hypothetical protein